MAVRRGSAEWKGGLKGGHGTVRIGAGGIEAGYSFKSRFEEGEGTNPEELIGAAHAGCFSMALAAMLEEAGHAPNWVRTSADVELNKTAEGGFAIGHITLRTEASVAGIDPKAFVDIADKAKRGCPVSVALKAVEISLEAKLAGA
jgi:osmotically inducible protein OsmC